MKRKPTFIEALVPLLGMVLLLGIGYGKYGLPIQFLLIVAAFIASIIAKRCGYTWQDMITGIADKIQSSLPSLLVMVCVGAMIGSWMVSGTIPMLIYYGIKIIDPQFLFVTAFFVTAVISTFTGTSFGSAGTAGVAIMGIAIALGVPLEIAPALSSVVPYSGISCLRFRIRPCWLRLLQARIYTAISDICFIPQAQQPLPA